jgi:transmembrane sensor
VENAFSFALIGVKVLVMSYKDFKVEDLVQDAWFREWVCGNDPEARSFWEKWIQNNPEERDKVEQASQILRSLSYMDGPMPVDRKKAVWKAIRAETIMPHTTIEINRKKPQPKRRNSWTKPFFKIAATFLILAGSIYAIAVILQSIDYNKVAQNGEQHYFEKATNASQRINFSLPDGSLVYLNSTSKVIYKTGPDGLSREVYLEGEAFFDVESDKDRPFKVYANSTEITAIGTAFNVKIGDSDSDTEVSLVEGKVEVVNLASENKEALYLNEGERALLVPSEKTMAKSTFEPELVTIWKEGLLLFESTSILTVQEALERWYGVKIIFRNKPTKDLTVTGRFDKEYLGNVLESLSYSARFDYKIDDKTVYITFKPNKTKS